MKIIVYDPLFSMMGHFFRYNKFILKMLSDIEDIKEIVYIESDNEGKDYVPVSSKIKIYTPRLKNSSFQVKTIQTAGIYNKTSLHYNALGHYRSIVDYINKSGCDYVFFTSTGQISFWYSVQKLKIPYIVSAISVKWLYDKYTKKHILYYFYNKYLLNSSLIFVTENYYQNILIQRNYKKVKVLNDRFLNSKINANNKNLIQPLPVNKLLLTTLGTISKNKNPIDFIENLIAIDFQKKEAVYKICGKSIDAIEDVVNELIKNIPNIYFKDGYISNDEFETLIEEADFIVIPYDYDYTRSATSGIMWDCLERQKPIICPNLEPFQHYVENFKIGFLYSKNTLHDLIDFLIINQRSVKEHMQNNFIKLFESKSYEKTLNNFEEAFSVIAPKNNKLY